MSLTTPEERSLFRFIICEVQTLGRYVIYSSTLIQEAYCVIADKTRKAQKPIHCRFRTITSMDIFVPFCSLGTEEQNACIFLQMGSNVIFLTLLVLTALPLFLYYFDIMSARQLFLDGELRVADALHTPGVMRNSYQQMVCSWRNKTPIYDPFINSWHLLIFIVFPLVVL